MKTPSRAAAFRAPARRAPAVRSTRPMRTVRASAQRTPVRIAELSPHQDNPHLYRRSARAHRTHRNPDLRLLEDGMKLGSLFSLEAA